MGGVTPRRTKLNDFVTPGDVKQEQAEKDAYNAALRLMRKKRRYLERKHFTHWCDPHEWIVYK